MSDNFEFTEATKEQAKARVALAGPTGSGKTWTGMVLATVFSGGEQFAVIDTERGSASKYVGPFKFHRLNMYEYDPRDLIKAIGAADKRGFPCLMVDSLSRFWSGKSGMLELVDNSAKRNYAGNSFGGWKDARPIENDMIEAMLGYSGHLIVTMRTKTAYEVTKNDRGQVIPVKIGLQPEQRQGIEYEFDIVGDMDLDNNLTVSKTRCPDLTGKVYNRPGPDVGVVILNWLNDGAEGVSANDYRDRALDPGMSFADLGRLKQEVRAAGKLGAMVMDLNHGDVITLDALINRRGNEAKGAAAPPEGAAVAHVRQPKAPQAEETPAQAVAAAGMSLDDLGDWAAMIDAISGPADEPVVMKEIDEAEQDGRLDEVKAGALRRAAKAKIALVAKAAAA